MNPIEVTYGRALKIWWSYVWRSLVTMIPVLIIVMIISVLIFPFPKPGQPAAVLQPGQAPGMLAKTFTLWLFMMALNLAVQVHAMRWMLKTKWNGFRLQAVADE